MSEHLIAKLAYKGHPVVVHTHGGRSVEGQVLPIYSVLVDQRLVFMDPCPSLEEAYKYAIKYVDRKDAAKQ